MCDFSLKHLASRPATVDDKLETKLFSAGSSGFYASDAPDVAVCVMPGTEIAFDGPIVSWAYDSGASWSYGRVNTTHEHSVGIFRQIDVNNPNTHHDALELPDGTFLKLNNLVPGQKATVLQLPAAPKSEAEAEEQKRLEVVG